MFKVLDQKSFHTYEAQVKLVLACFISHSWILAWGKDDFFPETVMPNEVDTDHDVEQGKMKLGKRRGWSGKNAMWHDRGNITI
jgi:hypothetical protein